MANERSSESEASERVKASFGLYRLGATLAVVSWLFALVDLRESSAAGVLHVGDVAVVGAGAVVVYVLTVVVVFWRFVTWRRAVPRLADSEIARRTDSRNSPPAGSLAAQGTMVIRVR